MSHQNVVDFHAHRPHLGIFRAVSCRDGASLERDGHPYVAMNVLETRDGRPEAEVQFTDGHWLLVDPTQDLEPA